MSDYEQVSGTTVSFDLAGFEYEQVSGTTVDIELQLRDPQLGTFSATSTFSGEGFTARRGTFSATSEFSSVGVGSASASGSFDPTAAFNAVAFASASASGTFSVTSTFTASGPNVGLFEPQSTFAADTIGLTGDNLPVEWRVTRNGEFVEDTVFDVDPVVDTANPFGDYCVIKMDDSNGEKFANYARGTRVDVAVSENAGITFDNRFTGYVVERRETEQNGADVLEVEAYSFDQFLRRNTVTNDQTGNLISDALEDIITTDTPVTYVDGNIDVGDEQELTRSYQGEAVETVLRDLAFKSNNEDFGVNDDLEFFFRERETVHIDRGIDNTQWFNYDIPELGKEAINEVEVWFDDGEESVIVDDGTDKLDLQDSLELADPGTQRAELNRPLLTDINDAEDEGRKYLQFRNSTLSGTVTTFGLFDAEPGDTIDIEIQPRGIDEEFVIAAIEYRWGVDETILTIVEKRGDVDDILSELNESVQRVEMEGANRDAPKNRITTTDAGAVVNVNLDRTPDGVRFVNDGRRLLRDAWTGEDVPAIDTIVFGDDNSGLSRSNSSLRNQIESVNTTPELDGDTSVQVGEEVLGIEFSEIGLKADDTLVMRAVYDEPVDIGLIGTGQDTIQITLTIENDDSVSRGVLTNDGQASLRDVLADNTPALPNAYAYGDDGTAVDESDTAFGNELVTVPLDEALIQSADANSEWSGITSLTETDPVVINNGQLNLGKSGYLVEAEDADSFDGLTFSDDDLSGGTGVEFGGEGDRIQHTFTIDYTIPAGSWNVFSRDFHDGEEGEDESPRIQVFVDGTPVSEDELVGRNLDWSSYAFDNDFDLSPGTHTIEIEYVFGDVFYKTDLIGLFDTRFDYNFDNTELSTVSRSHLNGPELFPNSVTAEFDTATFRKNITAGRFESVWNDTSNNQYIQINNERFNNTANSTFSFSSSTDTFDPEIRLSRFPVDADPQEATPRFGYNGQSISSWELLVDVEEPRTDDISQTLARGVVQPDTITGETLREAGLKSDETLLTRHELAEFEVLTGQRISSSESTTFTGDN